MVGRKEAFCAECGSHIYVAEISDTNLRALYDVYRQANGIIALAMIREIPMKYAIGKRPLSLLLGWGEQTFSRYYDGDMPTKQYSDILVRIYNEPELNCYGIITFSVISAHILLTYLPKSSKIVS